MFASSRARLLWIAFFCAAAIVIALITQYVFGYQPCAWCVLQRLIYIVIGIVCLVFAFAGRCPRVIAGLAAFVLSLCGIATAWYQYTVAEKLMSCDMTLADRIVNSLHLDRYLPQVFGVLSSCMNAAISVLGVPYVILSLILYVILALLALSALKHHN